MKITIINSTDKPYSQLDFDNKNDYSIINLKQLDIKYCLGCFECWYKTPGICVQKDDMPIVLSATINSDLTVFVSDVKVGFVSAALKKINDKSIPLLSPYMSILKDEVHHAPRYDKYPEYGLILTNDYEIDNEVFELIESCYKRYAYNFRSELKFTLIDHSDLGGLKNEINHN